MNAYAERVRVDGGEAERHPTLFDVGAHVGEDLTPRGACRRIGLNWLAAEELHRAGHLSFDPNKVDKLDATQEAELVFLGSLAAAGCGAAMIEVLLSGLRKPYAYRMDRMYYDWRERTWRILPDPQDAVTRFERWVDGIAEMGELKVLQSLRDIVDSSIRDLHRASMW